MHSQELLDCDQVLIRGVCEEHWAQSIPDHGASSIGCTRSSAHPPFGRKIGKYRVELQDFLCMSSVLFVILHLFQYFMFYNCV